jgi:hypothetical protein
MLYAHHVIYTHVEYCDMLLTLVPVIIQLVLMYCIMIYVILVIIQTVMRFHSRKAFPWDVKCNTVAG